MIVALFLCWLTWAKVIDENHSLVICGKPNCHNRLLSRPHPLCRSLRFEFESGKANLALFHYYAYTFPTLRLYWFGSTRATICMWQSKNLHMTSSRQARGAAPRSWTNCGCIVCSAMHMAEPPLNLNVMVASSDIMITVARPEYDLSTIGYSDKKIYSIAKSPRWDTVVTAIYTIRWGQGNWFQR